MIGTQRRGEVSAEPGPEGVGDLVARARAPEASLRCRQEAFGELVRRHQDLAYGYAYALLSDPHLAQDATQEAFLTAYRSLGQLRVAGAFPGWLRRIVRTHCRRFTRGARPAAAPLEGLETVADGTQATTDPTAAAEAGEL